MQRNRQRNFNNFLIFLLVFRLFEQLSLSEHPVPVTIALIILNIYPHMFEVRILGHLLSSYRSVCLQPESIIRSIKQRGIPDSNVVVRVLGSGFVHGSDMHLYYNMLSLCYKGMSLEGMLGSKLFLFIVSYSLVCSHLLIVLHSYIVYSIFNSNIFGYLDCSFGFSSVLYSLKYICSELEIERNIRNPFEPQQVCILPGIYFHWISLKNTRNVLQSYYNLFLKRFNNKSSRATENHGNLTDSCLNQICF